VIRVIEN